MASTVASESLSEYERERGKPMPSFNHNVVQARLIGAFIQHENYTVASELTLDLDPPAVPDVCVYAQMTPDWTHDRIRMAELPLLAVEIQSPSQSTYELAEKIERYLEAGVQSAWLVEPVLKLIAIYTPDAEPQIFTQGEVIDPATGIRVTIEEIFR